MHCSLVYIIVEMHIDYKVESVRYRPIKESLQRGCGKPSDPTTKPGGCYRL